MALRSLEAPGSRPTAAPEFGRIIYFILFDVSCVVNSLIQVCERCKQAGLHCSGYKDDADLIFRPYEGSYQYQAGSVATSEEQYNSSDSTKNPSEASDAISPDSQYDEEQIDKHALQTFFVDYCVSSADRSLSRGYLDGLQTLLFHAGPQSEVSQAAKIVALANLGKKSNSPSLLERTRLLYSRLLHSFQRTISNPSTSSTIESFMTAVLLGLYEVCCGPDDLVRSRKISGTAHTADRVCSTDDLRHRI